MNTSGGRRQVMALDAEIMRRRREEQLLHQRYQVCMKLASSESQDCPAGVLRRWAQGPAAAAAAWIQLLRHRFLVNRH